jgi:hypothetical protein
VVKALFLQNNKLGVCGSLVTAKRRSERNNFVGNLRAKGLLCCGRTTIKKMHGVVLLWIDGGGKDYFAITACPLSLTTP